MAAEPLAGFSDGNAFLRSPDNDFILFPNGRLQVDTYLFHTGDKDKAKIPNNTFLLRRARLELGGWVGPFVYFWLAGDFALGPPAAAAPAAPSNIATTDNFIALAPWNNLAILQVGQFDANFTLENRTSDKYFDFMERSITVRAFGIPDNKEMGAMLHGFNDSRNFYYSLVAVQRRRAELQERRPAVRLDGARLGGAVLVPGRRPASRRGDRRLVLDRRSPEHAGADLADDAGRVHLPQLQPVQRRPTTAWPTRRCSCGRSGG